jgi:hypothetical protein
MLVLRDVIKSVVFKGTCNVCFNCNLSSKTTNHLIKKFILKKDSNEEEDDGEKVLFKLDYFEKKSFKQIHLDRPKIEYLQQRVP